MKSSTIQRLAPIFHGRKVQCVVALALSLAFVLFARIPGRPPEATSPMSFLVATSWVVAALALFVIKLALIVALVLLGIHRVKLWLKGRGRHSAWAHGKVKDLFQHPNGDAP